MSGHLLPFQAIYTGKSSRSVPDSTSSAWSEAEKLGFLLEPSNTRTYWLNLSTMKSWVTGILVPYFESQKKAKNLPPDQRCILQVDCWSVHRSREFRDWLKGTYPWIMLIYVPGGCMGLFQACDVGLQRVLKLAIWNAAQADVVVETINALKSGTAPEYVVNDWSLPTLRQRSLGWIVQVYHAVNRPDLIRKAFALCAVPNTPFNLSYESLVGVAARQALVQLSINNPSLYNQLATNMELGSMEAEYNENHPAEELEDEDEDISPTVDEACQAVLRAETIDQVNSPMAAVDTNSLLESDEMEDIASLSPAVIATRSEQVVRHRSERIRGVKI
ncbi:hypothetical protein FRC06_006811 [Ceratobasidium sp. 370]|nr:hypothetical protein FRC06_006811 [Ceratobasidium sp. 370]